MKELPQYKLDPKIKAVWRISDAIMLTIVFFCIFLVGGIAWLVEPTTHGWSGPYCLICLIVYVACMIGFMAVVSPLRYIRWRYEMSKDYLDIANGIIWRKRTMVPFIRVQNTDTKQGPILRAFGLASVTVSTAAGSMEIPGLRADEAEEVRDKAAELARLAKEDV